MSKSRKLAECRACNEPVSKKAKVCPHCGQKKPFKGILSWFWPIVILVIIIGMATDEDFGKDNMTIAEKNMKKWCDAEIRSKVTNPSTMLFDGYASNYKPQDGWYITRSFSAKNAFGLKLKYDAYCTRDSSGIQVDIVERGGY